MHGQCTRICCRLSRWAARCAATLVIVAVSSVFAVVSQVITCIVITDDPQRCVTVGPATITELPGRTDVGGEPI